MTNTFVEKKLEEFDMKWSLLHWEITGYNLNKVKDWLRTALLAAVEHGREEGWKAGANAAVDLIVEAKIKSPTTSYGRIDATFKRARNLTPQSL